MHHDRREGDEVDQYKSVRHTPAVYFYNANYHDVFVIFGHDFTIVGEANFQ